MAAMLQHRRLQYALSLMSNFWIAALVAAGIGAPGQSARPAPPASPATDAATTMTGCVSSKPSPAGQYTFAEIDGLRQYRLSGKKTVRKYAGQRVEIEGGTRGKGLAIRGGLWPAPSGGARGVAQDPAQASVAIHGNAGAGSAGAIPEFRVTKVKVVPGACE
jgi:hypothetical protein